MKKALVAILLMASSFANAIDQVMLDRLNSDLDYVASIYRNYYAPREWKETTFGWNIDKELAAAKAKVNAAQTTREYRSAVIDFINSTQDYHVFYSFYSTEKAVLPFHARTIEGKTILVYVDRAMLPEGIFPFQLGDEILSMNGIPVQTILKEIKMVLGANNAATDETLADFYLSKRSGRLNMPVPSGPVAMEILRQGQTQSSHHQLFWEYSDEQIPGMGLMESELASGPITLKKPMMLSPRLADLKFVGGTNPHGLGEKLSFLPDLGSRLWTAPAFYPFDAYIYANEAGKKIGVVRISDYTPQIPAMATAVFGEIVKKYEAETDAMVINQLNNPGGSVFYLYSLVSLLSTQSMATPAHRMALQPSDIKECLDTVETLKDVTNDDEAKKLIGPSIEGYPTSYQLVIGIRYFCKFQAQQYKAGKRVTDPYFIWGVDRINPHPYTQYSKPIVLLVNEVDFSGGDFFPAILQDNKRATVVGVRTAGAGGYVLEGQFPNTFGLELISFTGSIAERPSKNPIENLGVTPDILLPMTLDDYRNDFQGYLGKVRDIVNSKL